MKTIIAVLAILLPYVMATAAEAEITLTYVESEPGIEPYRIRYSLGPEYLTIRDLQRREGEIRMNLGSGIVESTGPNGLLVIKPSGTESVADAPVDVQEVTEWLDNAPPLMGRRLMRYRLSAGGQVCQSVVVAPGLAPEMVAAMARFQGTLADRQLETLDNTPLEFRTPCYMAIYVTAAGRYLRHGLPVQKSDYQGREMMLENIEQPPPNPDK